MRVAQVIVDIPTRHINTAFDYLVPREIEGVVVGSCVLIDFGTRPVVGYVVGFSDVSCHDKLKPVKALLAGPFFSEASAKTAQWIATEYACPLSEAVRLFTPPGGAPKVKKVGEGDTARWELQRPDVSAVDDRWVSLADGAKEYAPKKNATAQRALLAALSQGPVRAAELAADLGSVNGAIKKLESLGVVRVEMRRRMRSDSLPSRAALRHEKLTTGQSDALEAIEAGLGSQKGAVVLIDGVTGSGKTEVYLRAIEEVIKEGGSACVLVPEISLTPQTVGRFRSRFGDTVAVLHSRLSAGERFDQWDRIAQGEARVVVGARSALFAPLKDLRLIVIDEEHENSYKQGQAPRYHARAVAEHIAQESGATLVLGSASPTFESLAEAASGRWRYVAMPERVTSRPLPPVQIVDMTKEFADGHRSMFSRPLTEALQKVVADHKKAVLFLNRRGFASFVLCRECGYVPTCENCSISYTYHERGHKLVCHHCGATETIPARCPKCGSPYLRQFGAGTQRVEAELHALLPDVPVIRMDADTTKGKGAHERLLLEFEEQETAILLGTQMIAKGLDYPDVTLVGVMNADTTLHMPDFRATERTYQLLEQVAGRAGRGDDPGSVIVQTYWPDNLAIDAVAHHDRSTLEGSENAARKELGYPPFGRLANVLVWGKDNEAVASQSKAIAQALQPQLDPAWKALGPSPCVLSRLKGNYRWHILVKAHNGAPLGTLLAGVVHEVKPVEGVSVAIDVDPVDLL